MMEKIIFGVESHFSASPFLSTLFLNITQFLLISIKGYPSMLLAVKTQGACARI